jgi:zinc finger protein
MDQPTRRAQNPDYANQIDEFLDKLELYIDCDEEVLPFTFRLCDPSGNSFIQNPNAPQPDPSLVNDKFPRTKQQLIVRFTFNLIILTFLDNGIQS